MASGPCAGCAGSKPATLNVGANQMGVHMPKNLKQSQFSGPCPSEALKNKAQRMANAAPSFMTAAGLHALIPASLLRLKIQSEREKDKQRYLNKCKISAK